MPARKPILCLDFDGVIHSYTSPWKDTCIIPDPPVPGAIEFLKLATEHFRVCIYSTRSTSASGRKAMQDWLVKSIREEQGLLSPWFYDLEFPSSKPSALVTLDDRAITFEGFWPDISTLLSFKPWNKK